MSNIMEYEAISKKIKRLENEIDTFIQAVREIKEIRSTVGTLPEDMERSKTELDEKQNELKALITSANAQLADLERRAGELVSGMEKKVDEMAETAAELRSISPNNGTRHLEIHKKVVNRKLKNMEENFYDTLTRQKYAVVIMSALFIAAMGFFAYMLFIGR